MSQSATTYDYSRYGALKMSLADGIMTMVLSNPGRKNAVTPEMSEELTTVWDDFMLDDEVRVIVITGEGGDFCSGADLSRRAAQADQPVASRPTNRVTRAARKHIYAMLDCEKPILAKVRGVAYGFGANLAMGADMVFAAEGARICDSHVKAGMVAGDGGVLMWPLLIGMHRAKEYLMTGEPVPADVAERIGLINRCLPDDQLDAHVQDMAEKLRDLPPHAVNYTKASLNIAMRQMTGAAFEASLAYETYTMTMDDCREAARAFVEKRKGNFTGT
ncbi:enoyl-CoA hydratase-related protein [Phenylobacterium sp.]|uniref:enoyl-CoA hydratase/isomerase family protein n=1 Tax=Phenylobacterium sp. TaxID=1871053 RepID=UPI00301BD45C